MTRYHGIIPPIVTPLNTDGTVNFADLDRLVEHLIASGVHGLFPMGSTGQVAYLTDAERVDIVRAVVSKAAGRVPVIVGAIELTAAREQGSEVSTGSMVRASQGSWRKCARYGQVNHPVLQPL